jgi:N6-L-threonylcarbamoyladenine synthase
LLAKRVKKALADTGIKRLVAGGGVAANTYLRSQLKSLEGIEVFFPSLRLCTDNGAMIAGIGHHYLEKGAYSSLGVNAFSRVEGFRKTYP